MHLSHGDYAQLIVPRERVYPQPQQRDDLHGDVS